MEDRQFGRIHFLRGENKGRYPFANSLYIEGDNLRVIIDPSCSRGKLAYLRDQKGVDAVWLSHWHEDHFTFLYLFEKCPLWISAKDFPPLTGIEQLLDGYGIDNEDYRNYWKSAFQTSFNFRPRQSARFIQEGEIIDLGSVTVEAIPTPGHTPGHLSFFFREESVLFMGDHDLTSFGPWYGDAFSNIDETIKSLQLLRNIPARVWLTGHDKGLFEEYPAARFEHYEKVIYERENKILALLEKQPAALDKIATEWLIYGKPREPLAFFEFGERALLKKHLERLLRQGRVVLDNGTYVKIH